MDSHEPVVHTGSLTKRYGRVLALDGLSLDVRAGEVVGFLGPNGAGKTTTLRLLMGYLRPTAGWARVHGLDCWRDTVAVHARTGYLTGDLRLWPRMSARAIAGHLARLRGLDHDPGTAELAKRLDFDLDRPVGSLWIDLGRVRGSVEVTLNDASCGVRSWSPYRFDLTPAACQGTNHLAVTVFNTLGSLFGEGHPSPFGYGSQAAAGMMGPVCLLVS